MDFTPSSFVGGSPALDFVNALEDVSSYPDLSDWAVAAGCLPADAAERLKRTARDDPGAAALALSRAKRLRDSLHDLFSSRIRWCEASAESAAELSAALAQAMGRRRLIRTGAAYALGWNIDERDLDAPWWEPVRAAVDLLTGDRLDQLKACQGHACGWLFLDASKNRSRSWCDMRACGNRAKAKRRRLTLLTRERQ